MKNIRNLVVSFVIFGLLAGLCVIIYNGFEDNYELVESGTQTLNISNSTSDENIMEHFERLNLIEGMNDIGSSIEAIGTPGVNIRDILGALAGVGIGVLKTIVGIVVLPISICSIILQFYANIPPIISGAISTIVFVIIGFILLSAYLRSEV